MGKVRAGRRCTCGVRNLRFRISYEDLSDFILLVLVGFSARMLLALCFVGPMLMRVNHQLNIVKLHAMRDKKS